MDQTAIGRQLRARRAAAGRTVASVAADAGLSVPYIANLENGRGNPTLTALSRLAEALGLRLVMALVPAEAGSRSRVRRPKCPPRWSGSAAPRGSAGRPGRWRGHSARTRRSGRGGAGRPARAARLALGEAMGRDLSEDDWSRILDALLLVAAHPLPPA